MDRPTNGTNLGRSRRTSLGQSFPAINQMGTMSPGERIAQAPRSNGNNHHVTRNGAGRGRVRRLIFRGIRLVLALGVISGAVVYARHTMTFVASDEAYITAEMVVLRTPIEGRISLEPAEPGKSVPASATVFRVDNPRFGNKEAMLRLTWASEYEDRLRVEAAEAQIRHAQQDRMFEHYKKLHQERLMPELEFLQEQTKWALTGAALTNKQEQLQLAESRRREAESQVTLQQTAAVTMPFAGVPWSILARDGQQVSAGEAIMQVIQPERISVEAFLPERHADKLEIGGSVNIRTRDGKKSWRGRVVSVRGGGGRFAYEQQAAARPGELKRRQVGVRVKMESQNPYDASEFFGVGRSVIVTLASHE